jgi:hypothetical protein
MNCRLIKLFNCAKQIRFLQTKIQFIFPTGRLSNLIAKCIIVQVQRKKIVKFLGNINNWRLLQCLSTI